MTSLEEFLSSSLFRNLVFPLGSAVVGILLKMVSRNDRHPGFQKEDLAVGLDLMLTALLIYIVSVTDKALTLVTKAQVLTESVPTEEKTRLRDEIALLSQDLLESGWIILLLVISIWTVSTFVRKFGWEDASSLKPFQGIAAPLAIGIAMLILVMPGAQQ